MLDPGIGLEGFVDVDQELLVERRMQSDRLRGLDDLAGEKVAHPAGAIDQDNFWRSAGKREAAIDVNLADAEYRDDGGDEDDGDGGVQGDTPAEIAVDRGLAGPRGGGFFGFGHRIVIIGRFGRLA